MADADEHLNCPTCGGSGHVDDVQTSVEEWNPHYGKSPREAWRKGFISGVDRANGCLPLEHKECVKALKSLGIENPHRNHVDAMAVWVEKQFAKTRLMRNRILGTDHAGKGDA